MKTRKILLTILSIALALCGLFPLVAAEKAVAAGGLELYTPYTHVSLPPGETYNYSIEITNQTDTVQQAELSVQGMPEGWTYELTAGSRQIHQISVKPDEPQSANLRVDVPLKVNKGDYTFKVVAAGKAALPITVTVSEQGNYSTELTIDQPNMEGHSKSTFTYKATLKNRTPSKELYALQAEAEPGWDVQFSVDSKTVTSVNVDENNSKDITIDITPPETVKAGSYKIPVYAHGKAGTVPLELEAVVTGSYSMRLGTSDDRLSTEVTAGKKKKLTLVVANTGTSDLHDITLTSQTPTDWDVTFEPSEIKTLAAGKTAEVKATISASDKAIAGDYVVSMTARAPEASSAADFRVAVKTSVLWGWFGVIIILAVLAGIGYLFRTYGRR